MCPVNKGAELRDDILVLVQFWKCMHSDKKYLRSNAISVGGELHSLGLTSLWEKVHAFIFVKDKPGINLNGRWRAFAPGTCDFATRC